MSTTTTEQVIMNVEMNVEMNGGVSEDLFPAEITVNEIIIRSLVNVAKNLAIKSIKACGLKYGFNAEEEIKLLNLENLTLLKKPMRKGGKDNGVSKKNKKEKKEKNKFPMPFEKSEVLEKCCQGLSFNRGLFTQCLKDRMESGNYCNGCQKKADKNSSGNPDCGTIASRQSSDLYSFKDPKGRSPISYLKFLENNSLTVENAVEEAEKNKIKLSSEHLTALMITEKKILKGRPKKIVAQIKTDNVTDLFSKLNTEEIQVDDIVADNVDDIVADNVDDNVADNVADNVEIKTKQNNKQKLTSEEKEIKQAAFDLEHATKKINRDKKIAEEKLVREMKLQALKDEKEAKLKQEKDEKEAKKKQEKDVKEAKKKQEKDEKKESKKESKKEAKKESKKEKKATPVVVATPVAVEPRLSVKKIEIAGKRYLLSSATSILYCPDTQKELGIWNPETKTIESLPEEEEEEVNSDEEEEEEEEEDSDEEELKEEAY